MKPRFFFTLLVVALALSSLAAAQDKVPSSGQIGKQYLQDIRPLLRRYCHSCHAGDRTEAEIDLGTFPSIAAVRKQPKVWQRIAEMLNSRQMPPKKSKQPSAAELKRLQDWVRRHLTAEAKAHAGDPGRVVLRRLSNAEYTYTIRDLTGVNSLDPARQFPVDGAAGEGFTNTGGALVMSPSLIRKYLDAGKEIARHAVLLPNGIRFSARTSQRDWTDDYLNRIRAFYSQTTKTSGSTAPVLHGVSFDPQQGIRLDFEPYLLATLAERNALAEGRKSIAKVAAERKLNAKYLGLLWRRLSDQKHGSLVLNQIQASWRGAKPADAKKLAAEIARWQTVVWKFRKIGHIGRAGGPKAWMEPQTPTNAGREFKLALPKSPAGKDLSIYLTAADAGDGNEADYVIWKNARLVAPGRAPILLRDVEGLRQRLAQRRKRVLGQTTSYLAAAAEAGPTTKVEQLAKSHGLDKPQLQAWLDYLAVGVARPVAISGHFTKKVLKGGNYDFVRGWGMPATPSIMANSSDSQVRIPGISRPHSVVAHPSPTLFVAVGWRSPIDGIVRVDARLQDAHPECGNGFEWWLQHQNGRETATLWQGNVPTRGEVKMPTKTIAVQKGQVLSLKLGPRSGSHACDLTEIDLIITETQGRKRKWHLAKDVSPRILAGNPLGDQFGNKATWHFYQGKVSDIAAGKIRAVSIPAGSSLAKWKEETNADKKRLLAKQVQRLAVGRTPKGVSPAESLLFHQLQMLAVAGDLGELAKGVKADKRFGKHQLAGAIAPADMVVRAPATVRFSIPAELAEGRQLVVSGELDAKHGLAGSVQLFVSTSERSATSIAVGEPIITAESSPARRRVVKAFDDFRELFPIALCYSRIVPIDEVVTLTLFYREDGPLQKLILSDAETATLNRLWDELRFVSHEPLKNVVAFEQISEFATQDRPDLVVAFKTLQKPIAERAAAFRKRLVSREPAQLKGVLDFANRAWRRPLSSAETLGLRDLYRRLRSAGIGHDKATRLVLARILTSPAFLYRLEKPAEGSKAAPLANMDLANRLSYFLWSSMPDDELRRVAAAGKLDDPKTIVVQTRRMLRDDRVRRLAVQFACQWLHLRDFDKTSEKNEKLYPRFASLRAAMYEETVRFFEDMFRNDGSVLGVLNADHTFVNESLASHYGIDWKSLPKTSTVWRRADGMRKRGRGGILGMATVLASQSGVSRTSPILRGNWVSETLLGERLPRPPADVPQLPDAVPSGLTARQLIERHSSRAACAKCHAKIDPYGFALEQFDAIGRLRQLTRDTKTKLLDGKKIEGLKGLRDYLSEDRQNDVLRQFCRKLLGYALGREVQLSDEPLLSEMQEKLKANKFRFSVAVEAIVTSRQFREIRGKLSVETE